MGLYDKLRGITGDILQFLKGEGSQLKDDGAGAIEVRDKDDAGYDQFRVDHIRAANNIYDVVNLLNLRGRIADISYSFAGATPPSPGANTGKFGFCHTSGGSYTQGQIVYDTGTALILIPDEVATGLTTRSAISGAISFNANCFYVLQEGTWTLKGIAPDLGVEHIIELAWAFDSGSVTSTSVIPDGARVTRVINLVETACDGSSPTMLVIVDGSSDETILATGDSNMKKANQYEDRNIKKITSSTEGPVKLTVVPDGSTVGSGLVMVEYDLPSA